MNTLLVVDDESAFGDFVAKIAMTIGYKAQAHSTVSAFRHEIEEFWPTVLVLDLQMPETDGIELLREMAERRCPSKVLLISGMDGRVLDSAQRLGQEIGLNMVGTALKPVRAQDLRERLLALQERPWSPTPEALVAAIESDQLFLMYQPKIDVKTKLMVGVEALVRWRAESGRIIYPDSFIPLAESTGLIDQLTTCVVRQAFQQAGQWRRNGLSLQVAVNLSARNIHDRLLPDLLAAQCQTAEVPADSITLELTETASMQDSTMLLEVLSRFRLKGFHLSIDDFGVGYSSVVQLLRLPFSELKVDKSFISEMVGARESAVVAKTVIDMAHNLGLSAVAEGVETSEALQMLADWNCDLVQGYFFSKPVDVLAINSLAASPTWLLDQPLSLDSGAAQRRRSGI